MARIYVSASWNFHTERYGEILIYYVKDLKRIRFHQVQIRVNTNWNNPLLTIVYLNVEIDFKFSLSLSKYRSYN